MPRPLANQSTGARAFAFLVHLLLLRQYGKDSPPERNQDILVQRRQGDSDMNSDLSEAGNQVSTASEASAGSSTRCIEPAPLMEVLFEQLEYLTTHSSEPCVPGCMDCTRLDHVKAWLLAPFRTAV